MTRIAYQVLYARLANESPVECCALSRTARTTYSDWDDVKRLVYARSVATVPNDGVAQQDMIRQAQGTANGWNNGMQNEALAVNMFSALNAGSMGG